MFGLTDLRLSAKHGAGIKKIGYKFPTLDGLDMRQRHSMHDATLGQNPSH